MSILLFVSNRHLITRPQCTLLHTLAAVHIYIHLTAKCKLYLLFSDLSLIIKSLCNQTKGEGIAEPSSDASTIRRDVILRNIFTNANPHSKNAAPLAAE